MPRIQKIVYWLEMARGDGQSPRAAMEEAMQRIGWNDERGRLTTDAMLRNLDIATKLGCTDREGMEAMRRGRSPTVRRGPYTGERLSVDHIIPFKLYPRLDNVLANLELMPLSLNLRKGVTVGQRQEDLLEKFKSAGLLRLSYGCGRDSIEIGIVGRVGLLDHRVFDHGASLSADDGKGS